VRVVKGMRRSAFAQDVADQGFAIAQDGDGAGSWVGAAGSRWRDRAGEEGGHRSLSRGGLARKGE
jgi:hypothetical protein